MDKHGFTLIEMMVAISILSTAILGMGASAGYMLRAASDAGARAEALQAVEGRISQVVMDPRYEALDSLYAGTETGLPGLDGFHRVTTITHVYTAVGSPPDFTYIDYKEVLVSVSGPGLEQPFSRTMIVGSP